MLRRSDLAQILMRCCGATANRLPKPRCCGATINQAPPSSACQSLTLVTFLPLSCQRQAVVPLLQEIREFTAAGLALVQTMDWPYMDNGFGLLWVDAPKATADLRQGTYFASLTNGGAEAEHGHGWLPAAGVRWLTLLVIAGCGCGALSALVSCAVLQHGQSGPLAAPQLGSCASSGRA